MKITWVNHASFIFSYEGVRLIADPWLEGRVFNESWDHLAKTAFTYDDFANITHIWFSHEHPDHFFPPNLKKIPAEIAKNITVLYQRTLDKKVKSYCEKLGFKVIELNPFEEYKLSENVGIICSKVSNDSDSWLYIKTDKYTFLDVNDCIFKSDEELNETAERLGNVDVFFTQFSYASWSGNSDDIMSKKTYAKNQLGYMRTYIEAFKPKYTVPCASFVWFCNEANFHMNEQANRIADVYAFINALGTKCVVMYPGDEWEIGTEHDSQKAMRLYEQELETISERKLTIFPKTPFEKLEESARKYTERCLSKNNKRKLLSYKPFVAYLTDYSQSFEFSFKTGLKPRTDINKDSADIAFHSQNLKYCLDFDWGWSTILVAGTFDKPKFGNFDNFMEYEWIGNLNNRGKVMKGIVGRLMDRVVRV